MFSDDDGGEGSKIGGDGRVPKITINKDNITPENEEKSKDLL